MGGGIGEHLLWAAEGDDFKLWVICLHFRVILPR